MSIINVAHNAVIGKVVNAPKEAKLAVMQALSYKVDGAEHMASFKGGWDGRASFFDYATGSFPAGFVQHVVKALNQAGYRSQLVRHPLPEPLGPENPKVDDFPEDPRYDYQPKVVETLLRHGQITAQIATGGGKSRIAKMCFARIARPTLFLTTRGVLMYQMKASFEELGRRVGVMGDGDWSPVKGVNVGMVQTIAARLEVPDKTWPKEKAEAQLKRREQMLKILDFFEFVILEEAHEAGGNTYYEILRHCTNAYYRLALTATPFMRDSEESNMRLMGCSGPVAIRVSEALLISRGILAKPIFKYIHLAGTPEYRNEKGIVRKLYRSTPWESAYKIGIVNHPARNMAIVYEAARAAKHGLTSMVLVQHKKHGELLKALFDKYKVRSMFIFGKHEQDERAAAIKALKDRKIDVLIGSTILDVGVDVPAVGMVILAGGGKAEVALRQRIGRGLREKRGGGPNIAFIVDFVDHGNLHLATHARQRRMIVESTPGFVENILPHGQDFDYVGFGFKRVA